MKIRAYAALALVAGSALVSAAHASDGTISITGSVTSSTCTLSSSGNYTVALPTISTSALASVGATAGGTNFTIAGTGCSSVTTATAFFENGANTDTSTGYLKNTGTATGVEVELYNPVAATVLNLAAAAGSQGAIASTVTSNAFSTTYTAKYVRTGAVTAGTFASSVTYSMIYQ